MRATLDLLGEESAGALDDATIFLRAFGHIVVAWPWLDQVLVADRHADERVRAGKDVACRYFFDVELPQALTWLKIVAARGGAAASADPLVFA